MKLLIVEDNRTIATSLKKGLETYGHVVDLAFDGLEGYDLALNEQYDVMILDIMLPEKNGYEVCRDLRKEGKVTPILMLTARGTLDDKLEGLDGGADDYLVKPFEFAELIARVQALGRRPHSYQKEVLEFADLTIDTGAMTVQRLGTEINLSRREFALLVYLIKNAGQVISKDQLLEHVWEFDANVLPNTVEVYVGYLRVKLEKPFPKAKSLIKTVRGFGYTVQEQ